jgi:lipopolysaccharide/colanic/teichoic acid biosynthesis glycosyltransferase
MLIVLLPLLVSITIILLFVNNGRPFFTQKRPGKNERIFSILKFKSMNDKRDEDGNLLPDTYRLTGVGRFIRKFSIDEFPQLINVLKGEMSLIGPRPLLIRYLTYYTKEELIRFDVRPGITGLAQISGRNLLDWDSRLQKDIEYVKNLSFKQDVYILYKTFWKIIRPEGVVVDQDSHPDIIALDIYRAKKSS